ncbi:hypothetical protein Sp245p_34685 (plasmid) [Azospirillum baldaniorum]|nr:hypothetical protein Sp245p_34685 [Azospirillum baldaniorum]
MDFSPLTLSPLGRGWPGGPVRGMRVAERSAEAEPPHPNPLPRGERGNGGPLHLCYFAGVTFWASVYWSARGS